VEGPYGDRGPKKAPGEPILPMLVDAEVYKSFLVFAAQVFDFWNHLFGLKVYGHFL
jgi:hypothetical protein